MQKATTLKSKQPTNNKSTKKTTLHNKPKRTLTTTKKSKNTSSANEKSSQSITSPLPLNALSTSLRSMAVKRPTPSGYDTVEEAIGTGSKVTITSPSGKKKIFTGPIEDENLRAIQKRKSEVEADLKQAKADAALRSRLRSLQPDEEAVRYTQFLIIATMETEPTIKPVMQQLSSPHTTPRDLGYNGSDLPNPNDYTGFDTRYQRLRGFMTTVAEKVILELGGPGSGLTFASEETLNLCLSNFPIVWQMYNLTGVNTNPLNMTDASGLGPVMKKMLKNNQKRLPYGTLNDTFWQVLIQNCFNIDSDSYAKLRTCLESHEALAIYRQQLDYVQGEDYKKKMKQLFDLYQIPVPSESSPRPQRVSFVNMYRTLANDTLAEYTMKNIAPKYGFEGDVGYFLLQKSLSDFIIEDLSAATLNLLNKEIEEGCPIYVSMGEMQEEVRDMEKRFKARSNRRENSDKVLHKFTQKDFDDDNEALIQEQNDLRAKLEAAQKENLRKELPLREAYQAKRNASLPPRFKTVVTTSAERAKKEGPGTYVRHGGLIRPSHGEMSWDKEKGQEEETEQDDNEVQLPLVAKKTQRSLYDDDDEDIDYAALPYQKSTATLGNTSRARWEPTKQQHDESVMRKQQLEQYRNEEKRYKAQNGLQSFFDGSRPSQSVGQQSPYSGRAVVQQTGVHAGGMPDGAYISPDVERQLQVPSRQQKKPISPIGENVARRGNL